MVDKEYTVEIQASIRYKTIVKASDSSEAEEQVLSDFEDMIADSCEIWIDKTITLEVGA